MPTMRELIMWIREYTQDRRHQKLLMAERFIWIQLCVAIDAIDDSESALNAYIDNEFPADIGERYLRIYGAMQALLLQQDALRKLVKAISPTKKLQLNDVLKDIRDARHASVGHPIELLRGGMLSTHEIVQNSISKDGFELHSYPSAPENVSRYVRVRELIEQQQVETKRILTEVVTELRDNEESYRAQFRDVRLVATFSEVCYAFEKIFEGIRRNSIPNMSPWGISHLQKVAGDFERELNQRGISLDTYDSIKYLYKDIAHPLTELSKFILRKPSEIGSHESAAVFAEALRTYFGQLRDIATEIDETYASEPPPIVPPERTEEPLNFTITHIGQL
jgi:hypothetical protein